MHRVPRQQTPVEEPADRNHPGERSPQPPLAGALALVAAVLCGAMLLICMGIATVGLDGLVVWLLPVWGVLTLLGLAFAMRELPVGTAYAVWVGIGAVLTVTYAMVTGTESVSVLKVVFLVGIVGCVVGLKVLH